MKNAPAPAKERAALRDDLRLRSWSALYTGSYDAIPNMAHPVGSPQQKIDAAVPVGIERIQSLLDDRGLPAYPVIERVQKV
jgi:hypothetical protein